MMYDLNGILPFDEASSVPPGTALLVAGPPLSGKRRLTMELLAAGHADGEGLLAITADDPAGTIIDDLDAFVDTLDQHRLGVVDCCSRQQGTARPDLERITYVSSPADLTGISIGVAKILKSFQASDIDRIRHSLLSVSTLMRYLDIGSVFSFLHVYIARLHNSGTVGVFTLDPTSHDEETVNTLITDFDGVIELRSQDTDDIMVRIQGITDTPTDWAPLSL